MPPPSISAAAALLAIFLFAGCATPPATRRTAAVEPAPRARLHDAEAILRSLARERQDFLEHGTPASVFAVFYHHVTAAILERAASGSLPHSGIVLEMLTAFHADYARNRAPATREPHWNAYYNKAASLTHRPLRWRDAVSAPRSLILLGIRAHIDGDLPRSLVRVLQNHPHLPRAEIAAAFRSLDSMFIQCAAAGFADLATRTAVSPAPASLALQRALARHLIQQKRRRAWHTATRR